ncbi:inhibin alpha chain [Heteronotia binoei]|uniref:inhibin alpha chain n=1 Tax=Heteronotia binoei TaxID=13085 RepID=UPI00292F0205|nr:inhibin alpha chain [Heteronotia binoei]
MLDQSVCHLLPLVSSMLTLLLALLSPAAVAGCSEGEVNRQLILAKVKAHFLEFLGPAPQASRVLVGQRGLHRRHASTARSWEEKDTSQVIIFPSTDIPCEPPQSDELPEDSGIFTYFFQPSPHALSRVVTSAQLWFYTGPVKVQSSSLSDEASNSSTPGVEILKLSEEGRVPVATMAVPAADNWTVFHFSNSFLPYFAQKIFVLLIRCPGCPCMADAEKMPFLVAATKPKSRDRAPRSLVLRPSAALNLLQRPSDDATAHANCHRASVNITFEELNWSHWIVHPSSFEFHYCHGSCLDTYTITSSVQLCCAALVSTIKSLRVRTTTDGGYSFQYDSLPLLTQDCVCL